MDVTNFFNFGPDFQKIPSDINYICEWGSLYLITYQIVSNNFNKETVKLILNGQILQVLGGQSEFSDLNAKIKNIKSFHEIKNETYNPILVWCSFMSSHFELSKVAIAFLSICPSEASVERSFSMQSDVHSLERKTFQDVIEAEMRIKFNLDNDTK